MQTRQSNLRKRFAWHVALKSRYTRRPFTKIKTHPEALRQFAQSLVRVRILGGTPRCVEMSVLQQRLDEVQRLVQANGFYILVIGLVFYWAWQSFLQDLVVSAVDKYRLKVAQEPSRVASLDERKKRARLEQARKFLEEAEKRQRQGSTEKKTKISYDQKRKPAPSLREYNPLMGPATSRAYRPTRRVRKGG